MVSTGFSALDAVTGGFEERKDYLVYGNAGVGKTLFGLQFLREGLLRHEKVALITRRRPQLVLDQAKAFGVDMDSFASSGDFIIFEYTAKVVRNLARLKDDTEIGRELRRLCADDDVTRMVFDPVTPLFSGVLNSMAGFPIRNVIESFSELNATKIYILETPEGVAYLPYCTEAVSSVLRFEPCAGAANRSRLVVERSADRSAKPVSMEFESVHGVGLSEHRSLLTPPETSGRRRILVIDAPENERSWQRSLEHDYVVSIAEGAVDGLANLAAELPDLIVMEKSTGGYNAIETCKALRKNRLNMPVIIVGERLRRARDRVEILAAGADECLDRPVDTRLLRLMIKNLLLRYDASLNRLSDQAASPSPMSSLKRDEVTATMSSAYFYERVRNEMEHSAKSQLSFVLIVLRSKDTRRSKEMANVSASIIRKYDLAYVGPHSVAVLLSETDERGLTAFMNSLNLQMTSRDAIEVSHLRFDNSEDFLDRAKQLVDSHAVSGLWRPLEHAV